MPYAGRTLGAGHTYYWQVQVWDKHGHASSWPEPAAWQMDLLSPQDSDGARWIAYERQPTARIDVLSVDSAKDTYHDKNTLPFCAKPSWLKSDSLRPPCLLAA
jgi:hypothetical protein